MFGNHPVSLPAAESRGPPPAFASDPLINVSSTGGRENNAGSSPLVEKTETSMTEGTSAVTGAGLPVTDIVEVEGSSSAGNFVKNSSPVGVRGFPCYLQI